MKGKGEAESDTTIRMRRGKSTINTANSSQISFTSKRTPTKTYIISTNTAASREISLATTKTKITAVQTDIETLIQRNEGQSSSKEMKSTTSASSEISVTTTKTTTTIMTLITTTSTSIISKR